MNPILEVNNLVKIYNKDITAVDGISFSIQKGICFGLLGPNGAGKTTTIEIIENIIKPTSGEILYKGERLSRKFRQEVGMQLQTTSLFLFQTVYETVKLFHDLYDDPMPMEEVIRVCRLEEISGRKADKISGGQKQRLMLALALVNNPELVILDEPTTGLDPQSRRYLWDIVNQIKDSGKTIVLTTHYMEEAQFLCDEIAIIDQGKIIAQGAPDALVSLHCPGVTITLPAAMVSPEAEDALSPGNGDAIQSIRKNKKHIRIETTDPNQALARLMESKIDMTEINMRSQNLEDLFLKLTGKTLRQ